MLISFLICSTSLADTMLDKVFALEPGEQELVKINANTPVTIKVEIIAKSSYGNGMQIVFKPFA